MKRWIEYAAMIACCMSLPASASAAPTSESLSDLLKRQTDEFSEASQTGAKEVLVRYLDPDVVFTNETGVTVGRDELLAGVSTISGPTPLNVIIDWKLHPQGDVATATFTDVITRNFFGHVVELRYRSTETWARRSDGWKIISSDTAYVPHDPPEIDLSGTELDEYVGDYQLAPGLKVSITRVGDRLLSSTNGAEPTPLKFEARDVAFSVGGGNGRRIFLRGRSGHVEAYLSSRDGNDLRFSRVG